MQLGAHTLRNNLFVAPMAGVTDRPFRIMCRNFGAGYAVSEMLTSRKNLRTSQKTMNRANHHGESAPIAVQIAGVDAQEMADAARWNIDNGAQIIDINMGCPAKKVCNKWAGSALMQNEALALHIIEAVVKACTPHHVPVTLKMRTGWDEAHINAPRLAMLAEQAGVQMLTIHGRTRKQGYRGEAEHDTTAKIKAQVHIPVVANGDIDTPEQAKKVLQYTQADAIMVGRAAMGRPWIFREMAHYLSTGEHSPAPTVAEVQQASVEHLAAHYALYGEASGVRSARKHIAWYVKGLPDEQALRRRINTVENASEQADILHTYWDQLQQHYTYFPQMREVSKTV